ncbi:unnamed protein product [Clonostachys chloroleuca]|uniref:Uncharacterized protein n=1 Tax=Clonostachys chloroleuca TaxID=1926264 RepID=A0AA35LRY9_9HYPO|nr:unnamed protein product [Clonostachys chloroleuca]
MLSRINILVSNTATRQDLELYFYLAKYILLYLPKGSIIINSILVDSYISISSRLDYIIIRVGQLSKITLSYIFLISKESTFISSQTLYPNRGIIVNS